MQDKQYDKPWEQQSTIAYRSAHKLHPARIINVTWYPYRIPLPHTFTTNHEALAAREGVIIEINTDSGISGIGECAPLPEFSGGTLQDVLSSLPTLSERLHGQTLTDARDVAYQADTTVPTSTICGMEIALLDALGQATFLSLSQLLANNPQWSPRQEIEVNAVIGNLPATEAANRARQVVATGYRCLKLKMGRGLPEEEIARVRAVRSAIGPDVHLRLDANEAWNFEQAYTILEACADLDIQYVEQPLTRTDLAGMQHLRQRVTIPLAADEVLADLTSARRVLKAQAADIFILKPQLAGGLRNTQEIMRIASLQGVKSVITSTIEGGIGVTAALHLAAATPDIQLACGLATLSMLEDDLICEPLTVQNGHLTVPTGPGLGVHLDREALKRYILSNTKKRLIDSEHI